MVGLRLIKEFKSRLIHYLLLLLVFIYPIGLIATSKYLSYVVPLDYLIAFNLIVFLSLFLLIRRKRINIGKFLSRVLSGDVSSIAGVFALIAFLIMIGWVADYLKVWIDNNSNEKLLIGLSFLLTGINTAMLFILSQSIIPLPKGIQYKKPEQKKVLIVALSKFNYRGQGKGQEERFIRDIRSKQIDTSKASWAIPFRSIKHHIDKLERVFILVSHETDREYEKFLMFWEEFKKYYATERIKVIKSNPVNFNSLPDCLHEIHRILHVEVFPKYGDNDISMNISGGTALVSAAMIIASVKDGRQVEYIEQKDSGKNELLAVNVSLRDIYSFYPELRG